jgi:hypothetical protein
MNTIGGFIIPEIKKVLDKKIVNSVPGQNNTVSLDFETYGFGYYSEHHQMTARIYCFHGDKRVGTIDFIKEGVNIPDNFYDPSTNGWGVYLYYQGNQFRDVLAILEYEGPLSIWIETNSKVGGIVTKSNYEPVGEQEL